MAQYLIYKVERCYRCLGTGFSTDGSGSVCEYCESGSVRKLVDFEEVLAKFFPPKVHERLADGTPLIVGGSPFVSQK